MHFLFIFSCFCVKYSLKRMGGFLPLTGTVWCLLPEICIFFTFSITTYFMWNLLSQTSKGACFKLSSETNFIFCFKIYVLLICISSL